MKKIEELINLVPKFYWYEVYNLDTGQYLGKTLKMEGIPMLVHTDFIEEYDHKRRKIYRRWLSKPTSSYPRQLNIYNNSHN